MAFSVPPDQHISPQALIAAERQRLRHYLPDELFDQLDQPGDALLLPFIHLAAARSTIATYLPRLLVEQLLQERLQSPWLRWLEGSLLFADLSGSTALAERMSVLGREGTELVTEFLNQLFDQLLQVIHAHGGDLVAFGGDALLVFFGDTQHPHTAIRAALSLQQALHGYVREVPGVGVFPMHLHIGIETGKIAFVSAGVAEALNYSVVGEAVNGVAAAESLAGPGEIVAGPRIAAALHTDIEGEIVGAGSIRITRLHGSQTQILPPSELLQPDAVPLRAIPQILDDLDRLNAYLPNVLAARIMADPQRPQIEAELRPVTVLFAQIVGLEQLAEQLPSEPAAQAVQAYIGSMQEIIEQFGGVVNKLDVADQGIKIVAIFGAPTAYEDHTERAARSAIAMRDKLQVVQSQIQTITNTHHLHAPIEQSGLHQRIGINLGTAFAGNVGNASRKEYTVMGDAVNVAARVMSAAAWGEVWCSAAVEQAVEARMQCQDRGAIALKGKAQPLQLFQVLAERDTPVIMNDSGILVGRAEELARLEHLLQQAIASQGGAIRVVGEAGVGKSRLAAELLSRARIAGVRIIAAACFSYTSSIPYAAWGEWLKAYCGIVSGDNDAVRTARLSERLRDLGAGMEEWLPLLGDLVRLDIPETSLTRGLDPQLRQARRFDLIERMLRHAASQGPVLTFFEDLHWADPISLDLWRRLTINLGDLPVLLFGLHRPTPALAEGSDQAQIIELRELSASESIELADQLAGDNDLPLPYVQKLVERAAGNPLFLAELIHAVVAERGASGDQATLALEDLPESLNGLLLSRIDRLDEISRSTLRVASVIGQRIPFGVLQSIQPNDQRALIRQLARLDSEEMTVLEKVEPERVHVFRHALIQEVAYQSILFARRRELHRRIGEYLERRYGSDLDDYYGLLAHHYRLSDRPDKAVDYLLKAGHAARVNYANEEAIQSYRWALEALNGDDARPESWEARDALAEVFEGLGRYEEALAQHALIIQSPGVSADIARRAHRKRGFVHEKQGLYAMALEEIDRAMTIATSGVAGISPLALPRTYADLALVRQRLGEYDAAIAACEAGLASVRLHERTRWDDLIEADLHSILGGIFGMRGDYARCQYHFERCLAARSAAEDLAGVCAVQSNLGYLWQLQSQYERAIEYYQIAEATAQKIELPYVLTTVRVNAADALLKLGRLREAEQHGMSALQLASQLNAQHMTAQIHNTLGIVWFYQGRYDAALESYLEAQHIHRSLGSVYEEGDALINISLVHNALGAYQPAYQAAQQALERAEAIQSQRLKAEALIAHGEAARLVGNWAEATHAAAAALTLAEQLGSSYDQAIALRLLGQSAAHTQQPFAEAFEQSITLLNTIKHSIGLAQTWAAYGHALRNSGNKVPGDTYLEQAQIAFSTLGAHGELARLVRSLERS
jgi:adenylate cyclase